MGSIGDCKDRQQSDTGGKVLIPEESFFPATLMRHVYLLFRITTITLILLYCYSWIRQSQYKITCKGAGLDETKLSNPGRVLADEYTLATRERIRKLKENRDSLNPRIVSPFVRIDGKHRVASQYNLAACINEKVMCSLTQAIFCYLYDTECFIANNRSIYLERWDDRFCEGRNEYLGAAEQRPKTPLTLYMIRDPVEKFLSGYSNKCVLEDAREETACFDCQNGDVLCAVERFHEEIMRYAARSTLSKEYFYNMISWWPSSFTMLTYHALPSIWRCEIFDEYENYFFIKYGETPEEEKHMWNTILTIFQSHGVEEEKLDYIRNVVNKRSITATKSRKERVEVSKKLRSSLRHMRLLKEIYYYDSVIFDYPVP